MRKYIFLLILLTSQISLGQNNNSETNDFVQYWLPILEKNEMNFIHFYVNDDYYVISINNISPKPDTSIRIFMEFYGLDKSIEISEQILSKTERKGFTIVSYRYLLLLQIQYSTFVQLLLN